MKSAINWFEIPTINFMRAKTFYETILNIAMKDAEFGGAKMGFFPSEENGVGGAIIQSENSKPGADGVTIYLNCGDEKGLDTVIARIGKTGAKMILTKQDISPHGFIALFIDPDGNKIGLHAS